MATADQIEAAIERLAVASPDEIKAALDRLERAGETDILARVKASVSYIAEPEHRPFWSAVRNGYRPTPERQR